MGTIVTPIGEGIAYYNDLYVWAKSFDDDPDDPDFDALSYLEGDPDIIRCNGKKLYFMSIVLKGKRYVLTHDEVDSTEREMLTQFFEEDFRQYFETLPGVEQPTSENQ
uniref:hypothetical protein n=1 Tax=Alistipes sp. D31t1_170403_E11 TaxID=2787128 RepID=UPI00189A2AA6|nr:hypothetical protein [Alistipes sp. D31t1_170403_E11]